MEKAKKNIYDPLIYHNELKKIKKNKYKKKINMSFLSNFTSELLDTFIKVELNNRGFSSNIDFNPYDQIEQIVLNKKSDIYKKKNDVIVLAIRLENLLPSFLLKTINNKKELSKKITEINKRFLLLIKTIRLNNKFSKIIVFNTNLDEYVSQNSLSLSIKNNLDEIVREINLSLVNISKKYNDVFVFDLKKTIESIGLKNAYDKKLNFLSRMPFSSSAQIEISIQLSRFIKAIFVPPKKCLILDADNVLWGGIIGEDKLDGIKLSEDFPGNIYKKFHEYILNLRKKGVLLALASKNNQKDVLEVFKKHPDCILKKKHFSALEINWNDKATNIKKIAAKLNIGLDSMVFFDDNPAERELIKQKIPEVNIIEINDNPLIFEESIINSEFFDHILITKDDQKRADMYLSDDKRKQFAKKITNIDDYLISLKTEVKIGMINSSTIKRSVQLINKTNQFNLTVKRKSESEVKNLIKKNSIGLWIRVSDKFGDNGLVGIIIAIPDKEKKTYHIDTFLLSCRIIGRGIEDIFLSELLKRIKKNKNFKNVTGEYIKSEKNKIVEDYYKKQGFRKKNNLWIQKIKDFKSSKYAKFVKINNK